MARGGETLLFKEINYRKHC